VGILALQERVFPRKPTFEPQFAVQPGDLLELLSVEEIEQREQVFDPLGAVAELPFGHLNDAWIPETSSRDEIARWLRHQAD
jgi:hypothetical protein